MTEDNLNNKINIEYDLEKSAGYKKYWTSKQTNCSWLDNSLHWHHCDKETMEKMASTLPNIQKVLISIGNTMTDSIIHTDNEFQTIKTILNQQKGGRSDDKNINEILKLFMISILTRLTSWLQKGVHTSREALLFSFKLFNNSSQPRT